MRADKKFTKGFREGDVILKETDCFDEKPEWATHVAWFNNN